MYKTSHAASLFHVSQMTVGRWIKAFPDHFSLTAKTSDGSQRRLSDRDLGVMAYIAAMKQRGSTLDQIALGLVNGEGDKVQIPLPSNDLAPTQTSMITILQSEIADLRAELESLRDANAQNKLLKEQLAAAQAELREAYIQIGSLRPKG